MSRGPVDNRRLPVPDDSQPYSVPTLPVAFIDEHGRRRDGRTPGTVRPVFSKVSVIQQARGSAYIEMGQTKVICAVYGPREASRRDEFSFQGQLYCEFKFATFSCAIRRRHQQDSEEREFSALIREALESAVILDKYPKSRIEVFVTVLEDDGSALAVSLSSASLALADAGIEMYDLVIGASLRRYGDVMLLDPSSEEEQRVSLSDKEKRDDLPVMSDCHVTLGYMTSRRQMTAILLQGAVELK